jgi:alkylated DNA repair dioxygenase AlkB
MPPQTLFGTPPQEPEGFSYQADFLTVNEEKMLLEECKKVTLEPYVFEGYEAKRRVKSFTKETGFPSYLLPIMERAAHFGGVEMDKIEHAMITEYSPGTPIGWHRDMPPYNKIIGISLGSAAPFRFRREKGTKWERITITAEPRSIYVMSGPARYEWQHSIPPVEDWRYSITIRSVEK